jgi:hypothetical protein
MQDKTNQLLSSIRDTIKSYVEGEISFAQAGEACQELEKTCAEIEKTEAPREKASFLTGMFYHHNVENFAKLTVLFRKDEHGFIAETGAGNPELSAIAARISEENSQDIRNSEMKTVIINGDDGLSYSFVFRNLQLAGHEYILAAVASSAYFRVDRFRTLCDLVSGYLHRDIQSLPNTFDYLHETKKRIRDFTIPHMEAGIELEASIFIFDEFSEIFHHMGLSSLTSISDEIGSILRNSFSYDDLIIAVSCHCFLVMSPLHDQRIPDSLREKSFFINDIFLKYERVTFQVNCINDLRKIWSMEKFRADIEWNHP